MMPELHVGQEVLTDGVYLQVQQRCTGPQILLRPTGSARQRSGAGARADRQLPKRFRAWAKRTSA